MAAHGLAHVRRHPGMVLVLYAAHLAFVGVTWALAQTILHAPLPHRPAPGLLEWVFFARTHARQFQLLLLATGAVTLVYCLGNTLVAGAVLERFLGGQALRGAARHFSRLLLLRLLAGAGLAALGGAVVLSAPATYDWSLTWADERIQAVVLGGGALLFGLPLLALLLLFHFGQPLAAKGRWPLQALGEALRLVHHRPTTCVALYLVEWAAWLGTLALFWPLHGIWLIVGQAGVIGRVAIHLWGYGSALAVVEDA
jgi:hypothetical protein